VSFQEEEKKICSARLMDFHVRARRCEGNLNACYPRGWIPIHPVGLVSVGIVVLQQLGR
jgi:hypothetical protein